MNKQSRISGKELLLKIIKVLVIFIAIPFLLMSIFFVCQIKNRLDVENRKMYCVTITEGEKIKKIKKVEEGCQREYPAIIRNVWVTGIKNYEVYIKRQPWSIKYVDTSHKKTTFDLKGKEIQTEAIYYIDFTKLPRDEKGNILDYDLGDFYISFYKEKGRYVACYHFSGQRYRLALLEEENFIKESIREEMYVSGNYSYEASYIWLTGIKDYQEYMTRQAWVIQCVEENPDGTTLNLNEKEVSPKVVYHLGYGEEVEEFSKDYEINYYPTISFYKQKGQDTYTACYRFGYQN